MIGDATLAVGLAIGLVAGIWFGMGLAGHRAFQAWTRRDDVVWDLEKKLPRTLEAWDAARVARDAVYDFWQFDLAMFPRRARRRHEAAKRRRAQASGGGV